MSYQDVRKLTETMRILQYPRIVSVKSFQHPNFELVADLLCWMVHRYDEDITIHTSIDTEDDRVLFITGIVKSLYQKSNIQLNAKKLYSADGHAVKELLKLALLLKKATVIANGRLHTQHNSSYSSISSSTIGFNDIGDSSGNNVSELINITDVKNLRKLASEVTEKGAKLFELLRIEKEKNTQQQRDESLKFLDAASTGFEDCSEVQHIETCLLKILEAKRNQVTDLERECKMMESDRNDLLEEMKKKTMDLERNRKRLESIQNARPTFMDEYEQLEIELQKHYDLYMERYRNIHYLRKEMETFRKEEEEKINEIHRSKKKLQSKIQEEELKILRDEHSGSHRSKRQEQEVQKIQYTNIEIQDAVPLLDTTDDSSIIIRVVDGNDEDDAQNDNVFMGEDGNISGNGGSSFGVSMGTHDSGHTISSSKASSFSVVSGISSNGNEDDESNDMTCNESSDSSDNF